jgi:hypothetical protein
VTSRQWAFDVGAAECGSGCEQSASMVGDSPLAAARWRRLASGQGQRMFQRDVFFAGRGRDCGPDARGVAIGMTMSPVAAPGDGFDLRCHDAPALLEPAVVLLQAQHVLNQDIVAA